MPVSICAPASCSFTNTASSVPGRACVVRTLPPVIAAATKKVPVSMRSATTEKSAACMRSTPSMVMVLVPAPLTFAPIAFRKSARSTISGSCAAFSIWLMPVANTAAIIAFSVPVTVTTSIRIRAPTSFFALARMKPFSTCTSAPSACIAFMCKLTGRAPIAHPPGKDTSAWPYLASNGPSTRIDARIVLTSS